MTKFGKFLTGKTFIPIFFVTLFLANIFVYWEFNRFFSGHGIFLSSYILIAMLGMIVIYLLLNHQKKYGLFRRCFIWLFGYYMSLFLCLAFSLLIFQMIANILMIGSTYPWNEICFVVGCTVALLFFLYGILHARVIRIVNDTIPLKKEGEHYRIVLLSDLHIGQFVKEQHIAKIVHQTNDCEPDLIVIAGDLFNGRSVEECQNKEKMIEILRTLRCADGVFAVCGNHDPDSEDILFRTFLSQSGISLLEDSIVTNNHVTLIGRKDVSRKEQNNRLELSKLLNFVIEEKPYVVIDHDPGGVDEAIDCGADMVLCGHTHKGQLFPMNLFTKASYGKERFWGVHRIQNTWAVVSAGAGYFQLPLRICSDNEIVCIDLIL